MVTAIREIGTCILGVKEGEQNSSRPENAADSFDHRLNQRLMQIVRNVPAQDGIEPVLRMFQIFRKKCLRIDAVSIRRLVGGNEFSRGPKNVFVVDAASILGEKGDIG